MCLLFVLFRSKSKQASIRNRGLNEWWCQLQEADSVVTGEAMADVDAVLESWRHRWEPVMATGSFC